MSSDYVLEDVACPRCGSAASRPMFQGRDYLHETKGAFTASVCAGCGLWFQNPRPTAETIGNAYPAEYAPHVSVEDLMDPPLDARTMRYLCDELGYPSVPLEPANASRWWQRWRTGVDLIPHWRENGSLLEIGAASGRRLRALQTLGWRNLTGNEMMPAAVKVARDAGFHMIEGSVEDVTGSLPDATFDVVIASFVLEHFYDPFAVVREIARIMKPNGEFLFSTISRDSIDARVWGRYWGGFDFPRHMVYFRTRDLLEMVRADFDCVEQYHHHAIQDFSRSAWWRLMEHRNLTDRIVGRLVKTQMGNGIGQALAWAGRTSRISIRCRRRG